LLVQRASGASTRGGVNGSSCQNPERSLRESSERGKRGNVGKSGRAVAGGEIVSGSEKTGEEPQKETHFQTPGGLVTGETRYNEMI